MSLSDHLPTFLPLGRFLLKWSLRGFFVLVCLATLFAILIAEENFRGHRAWENYKQDALAHGVKFSLSELIPPPVPDDQNFFMTPLLKPYATDHQYNLDLSLDLPGKPNEPDMGYWQNGQPTDLKAWTAYLGQGDILSALKKYSAKLNEISAAAQRPYARYPVSYNVAIPSIMVLGPYFGAQVSISNVLELRALAELASGQTDSALADTLTIIRLAHTAQGEPNLLIQLTSAALLERALQVLWEGLSTHRWNDAQLGALQAELPRVNLLPGLQLSMQGERARLVGTYERLADMNFVQRGQEIKTSMDYMRHGAGVFLPIPRAIFYQNLLNLSLYYDQRVFPSFDVATQRFYPAVVHGDTGHVPPREQAYSYALLHPYHVLMTTFMQTWPAALVTFARAQTQLDEATVACALERFRLAHGHYPDALDALVPQFIAQLPHDVITGGPLHYQRTADGRFLLYSVGWNETDDHGTVVKGKDGEIDRTQGDWVWPNPAI